MSDERKDFSVDDILSKLPSFAGHKKPARGTSASHHQPQELPPREGFVVHEVQANETLEAIALHHGLSASELRTANRLAPNTYLYPGKLIYVPDPQVRRDSIKLVDSKRPRAKSAPQTPNVSQQESDNALQSSTTSDSALGIVKTNETTENVDNSTFLADYMPPPPPPLRPAVLTEELMSDEFANQTIVHLFAYLITDNLPITVRATEDASGNAMVPGILDMTSDFIEFSPDPGPLVSEVGRSRLAFRLEMADLLLPRSQLEPPNFASPSSRKLLFDDAGEFHRVGPTENIPRRHHSVSGADDLRSTPLEPEPGRLIITSQEGSEDESGQSAEASNDTSVDATPPNPAEVAKLCYLRIRQQIVFGLQPTPDTVQTFWFATTVQRMDRLYRMVYDNCRERLDREWEMIRIEHESLPVKALQQMSKMPAPSFVGGESCLVSEEHIAVIQRHLPLLYQASNWHMLFNTQLHGFSLSNLYRHCQEHEGAVVLLVEDRNKYVFGAFTPDTWYQSERFYGRGGSFLFTMKPETNVYPWSGSNNYVQIGKRDALAIGGGTGSFGLWLDENLDRGRSVECATFQNQSLASHEHFRINNVEVWGLVQF